MKNDDFKNVFSKYTNDNNLKTKNNKEKIENSDEKNNKTKKTDTNSNKAKKTYAKKDELKNVDGNTKTFEEDKISKTKKDDSIGKELSSKEAEETKIPEESIDLETDDLIDTTALNSLAEILNVSASDVKESLDNLNLNLEDLNNKENLIELTKDSKKISSDAEFINTPDIKETIKELEKFVEETSAQDEETVFNEDSLKHEYDSGDVREIEKKQDISKTDSLPKSQQARGPELYLGEKIVKNDYDEANFILDGEEQIEPEALVTAESQNDSSGTNNDQGSDNKFVMDKEKSLEKPTDFYSFDSSKIEMKDVSTLKSAVKVHRTDTFDIIEQLVSKIKVNIKEEVSTIRITLHPETLGDVSLKIETINGIVTAQFVADNEKIKEIIESGFNELKQSLQEQGVDVFSLSVSVGSEEKQEQNFSSWNQNNNFFAGKENSVLKMTSLVIEETVVSKYNIDSLDSNVNYMA